MKKKNVKGFFLKREKKSQCSKLRFGDFQNIRILKYLA